MSFFVVRELAWNLATGPAFSSRISQARLDVSVKLESVKHWVTWPGPGTSTVLTANGWWQIYVFYLSDGLVIDIAKRFYRGSWMELHLAVPLCPGNITDHMTSDSMALPGGSCRRPLNIIKGFPCQAPDMSEPLEVIAYMLQSGSLFCFW